MRLRIRPRRNETYDDFMNRAMGQTYLPRDERLKRAQAAWRKSRRKTA